METSTQKKKAKVSVGKCEQCGDFVPVLYYNKDVKKWLCEKCHFKQVKKDYFDQIFKI